MSMILTKGNDKSVLFKAAKITVTAKDTNSQTLGSEISCESCSHLGYADWPAGTANFGVTITMLHVNNTADLYVV